MNAPKAEFTHVADPFKTEKLKIKHETTESVLVRTYEILSF